MEIIKELTELLLFFETQVTGSEIGCKRDQMRVDYTLLDIWMECQRASRLHFHLTTGMDPIYPELLP